MSNIKSNEPTIDELIDWLESATAEWRDSDTREYDAIRAILEQHRDYRGVYQGVIRAEAESVKSQIELEAIRAFVERVEKRKQSQFQRWAIDGYVGVDDGDILAAHMTAAEEELAAMEKGAE